MANIQKQRGHRARDRGAVRSSNSASGQWLGSTMGTTRGEETRDDDKRGRRDGER